MDLIFLYRTSLVNSGGFLPVSLHSTIKWSDIKQSEMDVVKTLLSNSRVIIKSKV